MDERPDTGAEWMSLDNRRLSRLERRLRGGAAAPPAVVAFLIVDDGEIPDGWEEAPGLTAPSGWVYVQRAEPVEDP